MYDRIMYGFTCTTELVITGVVAGIAVMRAQDAGETYTAEDLAAIAHAITASLDDDFLGVLSHEGLQKLANSIIEQAFLAAVELEPAILASIEAGERVLLELTADDEPVVDGENAAVEGEEEAS